AELLRDHTARFGNLGLAAAAYNAGPGRVERWLAGASGMPQETRDYVQIITGRAVEEWAPAGRWASLRRDPGAAGAAGLTLVAAPLFADVLTGRMGHGLKAAPSARAKTGSRRPEMVARSEDELCTLIGRSGSGCLVRRTY
ncbi:MAG: transglycosylase SLT domain-containing protein, partial [Parafilimonas terrae]|nr:transglycosylase SLT domain-containing protein [Parafilimonas terrae]